MEWVDGITMGSCGRTFLLAHPEQDTLSGDCDEFAVLIPDFATLLTVPAVDACALESKMERTWAWVRALASLRSDPRRIWC